LDILFLNLSFQIVTMRRCPFIRSGCDIGELVFCVSSVGKTPVRHLKPGLGFFTKVSNLLRR